MSELEFLRAFHAAALEAIPVALGCLVILGLAWFIYQPRIDACPQCPHCKRIKDDAAAAQQKANDEYDKRFYGEPLSVIAERQRLRRKPHDKVRGRGGAGAPEDDPPPVGDEVGVDAPERDCGD